MIAASRHPLIKVLALEVLAMNVPAVKLSHAHIDARKRLAGGRIPMAGKTILAPDGRVCRSA